MNIQIWKFVLETLPEQEVEMPEHAEILHVENQNGQPCIWASVNVEAPPVKYPILMRATGQILDGNEGRHLGTVLVSGGTFVWHVFTKRKPDDTDVQKRAYLHTGAYME